jgi:hypothetical protein
MINVFNEESKPKIKAGNQRNIETVKALNYPFEIARLVEGRGSMVAHGGFFNNCH